MPSEPWFQRLGRPGPETGARSASLIIYGLILIQPTAPMPLYGAVAVEAHGHVVTTILIGMVAMIFTAISYGRMANAYPSAVRLTPTSAAKSIPPSVTWLAGA